MQKHKKYKGGCLEVNTEETMYMFMYHHQNAGKLVM